MEIILENTYRIYRVDIPTAFDSYEGLSLLKIYDNEQEAFDFIKYWQTNYQKNTEAQYPKVGMSWMDCEPYLILVEPGYTILGKADPPEEWPTEEELYFERKKARKYNEETEQHINIFREEYIKIKQEKEIKKHLKRIEAGKKAAETRKKNKLKNNNKNNNKK